jgi:centrosomal protein POC5
LTQQLDDALQRVQKAEYAKEEQQDELKRALMRGVCALNMEAMSVLRGSSAAASIPLPVASTQQYSLPREDPEPSAPVLSDSQAAYEALMVPRTKDKVSFTLPKSSEASLKSSPSSRQKSEYGNRILVTRHQ